MKSYWVGLILMVGAIAVFLLAFRYEHRQLRPPEHLAVNPSSAQEVR